MSQRFAHRILFAVIALATVASDVAWAQRYSNDPRDNGLPASVRRIQRQTGGSVLKAQPFERDGREVYRVKVLTPQGRIRVYEDDPQGAGRGAEPQPANYPRQQSAAAYPRQGPPAVYPPRQAPAMYPPRMAPQQQPQPRNHRPE